MPGERTININGTFYSAGKQLSVNNRGFLYGDSLFESILADEKVLLWDLHYNRMKKGAGLLGFRMNASWTEDFFRHEILRTLKENKTTRGIMRLVLYRDEGGRYTPETDLCSYLIDFHPFEGKAFEWQKEGLVTGVYHDWKKSPSPISDFKNANSLLYVMAGRDAKTKGWQESIILNDKNRICEGLSTNLFLHSGGKWITPPASEACILGVMRQHLLSLLKDNAIEFEERPIPLEELTASEEIFLSNSVRGIRWIGRIGDKTYGSNNAQKLNTLLINSFC